VAAEKLGIAGDAANTYAKEVVAADFEEAGDSDVLRKVLGRPHRQGRGHYEAEIRIKMDQLMARRSRR